jgi:hypothetical protein
MGACLSNPFQRVGIRGQVKEPPKQTETVVSSQSEPCGKRRDGIGHRAGVVIYLSQGLYDDWRDCIGLFAVGE